MTEFRHNGKSRDVVLVKSCQKFHDRQNACRATWAGELSKHVPLWFLEGAHDKTRVTECWLLTNGGDDYMDNSYKLRDSLRFLLEYDPFDRAFICDDNTFVHPARWMAHTPGGEFEGLMSAKVPWVHGGAGWWMSRRCCELYVAGVKKRCSWDDTLTTDILKRAGIEMVNRPDLYAQWNERVSAANSLITCHNVSAIEMERLFEATHDLPIVYDLLR